MYKEKNAYHISTVAMSLWLFTNLFVIMDILFEKSISPIIFWINVSLVGLYVLLTFYVLAIFCYRLYLHWRKKVEFRYLNEFAKKLIRQFYRLAILVALTLLNFKLLLVLRYFNALIEYVANIPS